MQEKWRGNVNEVEEGPRRNSENYENHKKGENNKYYEILLGN